MQVEEVCTLHAIASRTAEGIDTRSNKQKLALIIIRQKKEITCNKIYCVNDCVVVVHSDHTDTHTCFRMYNFILSKQTPWSRILLEKLGGF